MKLALLPADTVVFVDANIFAYHFARFSPMAEVCTAFLQRSIRGELQLITSSIVVSEVLHRSIVYEAATTLSVPRQGLVTYLKNHPDVIKELKQHQGIASSLAKMKVDIKPVDHIDSHGSKRFRRDYGLMTNDSLVLAVMKRHKVTDLATNDRDFGRVSEIKVWTPAP